MPASWMQRQAQAVHERAKLADIVITTALIPGRKAPVLLSAETVEQMKPGSVVIDLAAAQGGNCPPTEADQVVIKHGVTIVGDRTSVVEGKRLSVRVGTGGRRRMKKKKNKNKK